MTAYGDGECVKFISIEGVMGTGGLSKVLCQMDK